MADVTVRVKAEPEFAEAESEARGSFGRIESDARSAAEGIEEPFERAAAGVGGSFDRVEGDVRGSLDGLEVVADRAADGIAEPFDRAAAEIGSEFDGIDTDLRRSFDRAEAAATSAAGGIESEFETAADRIPSAFDGVRSELGAEFSRMETDAGAAADGIGAQLSGIGENIDLTSVGATVTNQLGALGAAAGPLAGIAAGAGLLVGGELAEGVTEGFGRRRNDIEIGIRTGLDQIDVAASGRVAGEAYADGFGDGLGQLRFEVAAVRRELEGFDLGDDELQITKELQLLADQFGVDLPQSIEIARRAVANGLAPDITTALEGIFQLAQELPETFDLDPLSDYASTFGGLNVSMGQFTNLLAEVQRSGAFETTDKVGESVRELNTRLTETDELREPITRLGLDFEALQSRLASGDLIGTLLQIDGALEGLSTQEQNLRLGEIFGSSFEDVTRRGEALDVIIRGLTGSLGDFGNSLDDSTDAMERNATGLDRLKRETAIFGGEVGVILDTSAEGWFRLADAVEETGGPLQAVARRLGEVVGSGDEATVAIDGVAGSLDGAVLGSRVFRGSLDDLDVAAEGAADGLGSTEEAVEGLVEELNGLLNFSADQLMRDIADASDDLAAAIAETDSSVVGLNGAINTTTDEGRQLQAAFEDLSDQQVRAAEAYERGEITATEYRIASARVRAELDSVTAGSQLTQAQIDGLAEKYGLLPEDVETIIRARDEASGTLGAIRSAILGLPTSRTITVTTLRRASAGPNSPFRGFADGGTADGPALVGEEGFEIARRGGKTGLVGVDGPEIRDFQGPTEIIPHEESRRLLISKLPKFADGTSGFRNQVAAIERGLDSNTSAPATKEDLQELISELGDRIGVNIENWNVTDGRDSFQDLRNLESVYRMSA